MPTAESPPGAPSPAPEPEPSAAPGKAVASRDPLHGLTLEALLQQLVDHFGWDGLADRVRLRCFTVDPSIASSLAFLRRTPWARAKVEGLYLYMRREQARQRRG
jgi:uncharacterized protein (DUF2132 family)